MVTASSWTRELSDEVQVSLILLGWDSQSYHT